MKLRKTRVRFMAYGSSDALPVMGMVKLYLENVNGMQIKSIAYVVKRGEQLPL